MDDPNRPIAKRQIARLLGSSSIPICVISEEDTLVFANDAMGLFVGRPSESLLGLQCGAAIPADGSLEVELLAFFALPTHWTRAVLKLIPESGKVPVCSRSSPDQSSTISEANGAVTSWIRCLIPLEDQGCVLCAFCPSHEAMMEVFDRQASIAQSLLRSIRDKHSHLDGMWYLLGKSAGARRALEQVQIAIANPLSVTVFGPVGSGRSWLASTVFDRRRQLISGKTISKPASMLRIDCSLMDGELLLSMLEVIDESKQLEREAPTVLIDNLESLPSDCVSILASFLDSHEHVKCITTCNSQLATSQIKGSSSWNSLLSRLGCMRIDLPKLEDRIEDIATLVIAWFDSRTKLEDGRFELSDSFLDALTAYSWPGDIEELSQALDQATKNATSSKLSDRDLPVSIRTFVSHVEQSHIDDSVDLDAILEDVEKTMIMRALEKFPQNKTSAAKILNISRARLLRRLQQWGIQSESSSVDGEEDLPDFSEVL